MTTVAHEESSMMTTHEVRLGDNLREFGRQHKAPRMVELFEQNWLSYRADLTTMVSRQFLDVPKAHFWSAKNLDPKAQLSSSDAFDYSNARRISEPLRRDK